MRLHISLRMDTDAFGSTHAEMCRVLSDLVLRVPVARRSMPGKYRINDSDGLPVGMAIIHAAEGRDPQAYMASASAIDAVNIVLRAIDKAMLSPAAIDRASVANLARSAMREIETIRRDGQ